MTTATELEGEEIYMPEKHGQAFPIDAQQMFFLVWGEKGWGFGIRTTDDRISVFPRTPDGVTAARQAFAAKVGAEEATASMAEAVAAFHKMKIAKDCGDSDKMAEHGAEAVAAAQHAALAAETANVLCQSIE